MVSRERSNHRWIAIAFGLLTVAAVPVLPHLRNAAEPSQDDRMGQSLHTVSLRGQFLEIANDTLLRPIIGGWVFASADGDSLGAAPIDSGRYQIRLQVASGRVQLTYRQIGYDPQIRTVWVDHDMQEKLAPVCTVTAFGPLGATIHLPARALLDDEEEPICDYPLGKTQKPPDFGIKGNG